MTERVTAEGLSGVEKAEFHRCSNGSVGCRTRRMSSRHRAGERDEAGDRSEADKQQDTLRPAPKSTAGAAPMVLTGFPVSTSRRQDKSAEAVAMPRLMPTERTTFMRLPAQRSNAAEHVRRIRSSYQSRRE